MQMGLLYYLLKKLAKLYVYYYSILNLKICLTKVITYTINREKCGLKQCRLMPDKESPSGLVFPLWLESCIVLLSCCVLRHPFRIFLLVKLTEVTFLLEQLSMVVPTIKTMFMCHIIWWANYTPSMGAPETSLMVRGSIHSYLKKEH